MLRKDFPWERLTDIILKAFTVTLSKSIYKVNFCDLKNLNI